MLVIRGTFCLKKKNMSWGWVFHISVGNSKEIEDKTSKQGKTSEQGKARQGSAVTGKRWTIREVEGDREKS